MALDQLYVVDLKQSFENQDLHNIFTYQRDDTGLAIDLKTAFVANVLNLINFIQFGDIKNVLLRITNLGDLSDNWDEPLTGEGAVTAGQMLPVHDAVNFTLRPTSRAVRPGSKRFSGISESFQAGGTITDSGYIGDLNDLKAGLGTVIDSGDGDTFTPVIVKRVKYNPDPDRPEHFAYRFPTIGETPVVSTISGVLLNTRVSHQVSRK